MPLPSDEAEPSYSSYDPTDVRPDLSADPPLSSPAPEVDGSLPEADAPALPSFDERYVEDFKGLMYLGALTHTFEWLGHKFVIRTLTVDEYLAVALIVKDWAGTIGEARAYSTAVVALATESVDGEALPTPVQTSTNGYAWAYQRFDYVKARWFNWTIDLVYEQYLILEGRARAVFEDMGKRSGWAA